MEFLRPERRLEKQHLILAFHGSDQHPVNREKRDHRDGNGQQPLHHADDPFPPYRTLIPFCHGQ
jgi:hypothetical protein